MIYKRPPKNFKPDFECVSCFCEHEEKHLVLRRQDHKSEGNKWGPPAGKRKVDESISEAILREINEETGIALNEADIKHKHKLYVRYPEYDFIYHVFRASLMKKPTIKINANEHKDHRWVTPEEFFEMDFVHLQDEVVKLFYK